LRTTNGKARQTSGRRGASHGHICFVPTSQDESRNQVGRNEARIERNATAGGPKKKRAEQKDLRMVFATTSCRLVGREENREGRVQAAHLNFPSHTSLGRKGVGLHRVPLPKQLCGCEETSFVGKELLVLRNLSPCLPPSFFRAHSISPRYEAKIVAFVSGPFFIFVRFYPQLERCVRVPLSFAPPQRVSCSGSPVPRAITVLGRKAVPKLVSSRQPAPGK